MTPPDPALRIEDLHYRYGDDQAFTLEIPELTVPAGARAVCLGPSGSGKTTFLHLLAGILVPLRGRVVAAGSDWSRCSDAERRRRRIASVGLVFQEFELLGHLTVLENALLPYHIHPALRLTREVVARTEGLLARAGIAHHRHRKPQVLSQGERQRVALCRALATEPALLLADEPTGNLDPGTTRTVLELLLQEVGRLGSTLVMVTHDHSLLDAFDPVLTTTTEGAVTGIRPVGVPA